MELLVTIAILSIVLVSITAFMITGSRSFARGSADTEVQREAQLAVNQIEDLIIDVNGGVEMTTAADKEELIMFNAQDSGGITDYTKEVITWDKTVNKLFYSKWNVSYDSAADNFVVNGAPVYDNQLLAENTVAFSVDLSDIIKETASNGTEITIVKSVQIRVAYLGSDGKAAYATSPVITLRNRMMKSLSPKLIFDNTPTETDSLQLYISDSAASSAVPVVDYVTEVQRAGVYQFYAMLHAGSNVNDLVDWAIEETGTISTIDGTGSLHVGEYEANAYLTITASYKSNPSKKVSGVVKVVGGTIKSLDAVSIITMSLEAFSPKYASAVTTTGFTEAELASDLVYKWTVSEPDRVENFTDSTDTLDLKVKRQQENYGKMLTIMLSVKSKATGQTVTDSVTYRIDSEGADGDSNLERGKGYLYFRHAVPHINGSTTKEVEYYFCNEQGDKIEGYDSLKKYIDIVNPTDGGYTFGVKEGLPPTQNYYVKVIMNYVQGSTVVFSNERIFFIPQVKIFGRNTSESQASPYSSYPLKYAMSGYYGAAWQSSNPWVYKFEVVELEYDAPEGVELTPVFSNSYWASEGKNVLGTTVGFDCTGTKEGVTLKSLKVKVSFAGYEDSIYAYSTILFGQ